MRSSNIELLRIVSMLFIALHHFSWHGPWPKTGILSADIAIDILAFGGKLGCNLFVLVTGYYMIRSRFKIRSVIRLIAETLFYSWLILVIAFFMGASISFWDLENAILPISTGEYWFVTTFVILCFLAPLLNRAFLMLSQGQRSVLLCLGFILFVIIPTFCLSNSYASNLVWFCYVYYVGAYIRLSGDEAEDIGLPRFSRNDGGGVTLLNPAQMVLARPGLVTLVSIVATFLSIVILNYIERKFGFGLIAPTYLIGQNMITTALASFGGFVLFLKLKIPYSKIINAFGGAVFGVYLIHDNPFVRRELWGAFQPVYNEGALAIMVTGIVVAVLIFMVCSSFDMIRKVIVERPFMNLLDSKLSRHLDKADKLINLE